MKFLVGNEKVFLDYMNSLNEKDRVAILSHTDLDGIASAVFLEKILARKKIKPIFIEFLDIKPNILSNVAEKLKSNKIDKIIISDLSLDNFDKIGFEKLRNSYDVLFIDHHPMLEIPENKKNFIKNPSEDCSALVIYQLSEKLFDSKKWRWLVCATAYSEFSYNSEENFKFMKKIYSSLELKDISKSDIAKISEIISYSLIYFNQDKNKVFNLVLTKNLRELRKFSSVIKKEIDNLIKEFNQNKEFYPEKKIYFYYFSQKIRATGIVSITATKLSVAEPDKTFIFISNSADDENFVKASARSQNGNLNVNLLMRKGIKDLQNASGGGHEKASAARFMKKDLEKFRENILAD